MTCLRQCGHLTVTWDHVNNRIVHGNLLNAWCLCRSIPPAIITEDLDATQRAFSHILLLLVVRPFNTTFISCPEPSLIPAHQAGPWVVGVKSPTLECCRLVGGLVEMWSIQSEAAEWHGGRGDMQFLLSLLLQTTGYRTGERGQKEWLENGFDFHLFLYRINLERKFREANLRRKKQMGVSQNRNWQREEEQTEDLSLKEETQKS